MPTVRVYIDVKTLATGAINCRQWIDLTSAQTSPTIMDASFMDTKHGQGGGIFVYSYVDDTAVLDTYESFKVFMDLTSRVTSVTGVNVRQHHTMDAALTLHATADITSFLPIAQYHTLPMSYGVTRYYRLDSAIALPATAYTQVDSEISDLTRVYNYHDLSAHMTLQGFSNVESAIRSRVVAYTELTNQILAKI